MQPGLLTAAASGVEPHRLLVPASGGSQMLFGTDVCAPQGLPGNRLSADLGPKLRTVMWPRPS